MKSNAALKGFLLFLHAVLLYEIYEKGMYELSSLAAIVMFCLYFRSYCFCIYPNLIFYVAFHFFDGRFINFEEVDRKYIVFIYIIFLFGLFYKKFWRTLSLFENK